MISNLGPLGLVKRLYRSNSTTSTYYLPIKESERVRGRGKEIPIFDEILMR